MGLTRMYDVISSSWAQQTNDICLAELTADNNETLLYGFSSFSDMCRVWDEKTEIWDSTACTVIGSVVCLTPSRAFYTALYFALQLLALPVLLSGAFSVGLCFTLLFTEPCLAVICGFCCLCCCFYNCIVPLGFFS